MPENSVMEDCDSVEKDKRGLTKNVRSGIRSRGSSGKSGGGRETLTNCREQKTNYLGEEHARKDSPGVLVVVVEAGDEDTEREETETVVEEPVEDSAAVEKHEKTLKV